MSPAALALALMLHAATVSALWWISPLRPSIATDEAIDVTFEQSAEALDPPSRQPEAPRTLEPPAEQQPPLFAIPQPVVEDAVPPPFPLPPPPTAAEFPGPVPPAPSRPPPSQLKAWPPESLAPPSQGQRPSQPPQRPPVDDHAAAPKPSPLRNPSDPLIGPATPGQADYFKQVARRLAPYRYYPRSSRSAGEQGRVVMRITIARDGRLVDVRVERSSGYPAIDAAELDTVRRASPFPPLPSDVSAGQASFLIPVNYHLSDPGTR